ncbi:bifunctional diguanylate cyclase/phosphodiesterase [Noviherbaspirillum galbum]|uniref:EAL domain-containing protein n=1 Tax=Noviherbaspirillum galbum TaxID=2709383 RepID=A0A6B3STA7_9BURK|nr:EAL domain-containing protein [Noviherbaspirillum galbum]
MDLPDQIDISIVDADGRVLASTAKGSAKPATTVSNPVVLAAIRNRASGDYTSTDVQGTAWFHTLKAIDGNAGQSLFAAVSVKQSDVVSAINKHFNTQLALMGLASLIGLLAAWMFAQRHLARPVTTLLERMRAVEQGNGFEAGPPALATNVEFAELNDVFSSMLSKLEQNQKQLMRAQQITRVGFYQLDLQNRLYSASPIVYDILGLDPAIGPLTIEQYQSMIHPDDRQLVSQHRDMLFAGGKPLRLQYRLVRSDGTIRWIDGYGFLQKDEHGVPVSYSGAIQDITDRKLAEQETRANENRYRLLFENSLDGVLQTAPDGSILRANPAACRIFDMSEAELIARGRNGVVLRGDPRLAALLNERDRFGQARGVLTMVRGDGTHFEAELASSVYQDDDGNLIGSLILRDITERLKAEQNIHLLAFFDGLTQLPNRRLLMDRLALLHAAAQRNNQIGAVLYIDLDHFKNVNDARGHATGDALLQQVAKRLSLLMRAEDTVARIGGDEFVVLIPDLGNELQSCGQHAMAVADKIREALGQPFDINGQAYSAAASIGVTMLPKPNQTAEDLLREADTAMYRAKQSGRNRIAFFEDSMQAQVEERLSLENELARALGTVQLEMFLQPQFDVNGQVLGGELLVRWTHPVRGRLSPAAFIPIAEESDLICRLGEWAIREGCNALLALQSETNPITVSVNVSPRQFHESGFVGKVRHILAETGAPASRLIFEVTEGLLIEGIENTIARMHELAALGIRFSIDDFGTGYSSLAYLRRLPLYELKIDRSFVKSTPHDPGDTAIVQSILSLAKNLNLKVVAEGVESREQVEFLQAAGCDLLQGYLLSPPVPVKLWLHRSHASV